MKLKNIEIAAQLEVTKRTAGKWRRRLGLTQNKREALFILFSIIRASCHSGQPLRFNIFANLFSSFFTCGSIFPVFINRLTEPLHPILRCSVIQ